MLAGGRQPQRPDGCGTSKEPSPRSAPGPGTGQQHPSPAPRPSQHRRACTAARGHRPVPRGRETSLHNGTPPHAKVSNAMAGGPTVPAQIRAPGKPRPAAADSSAPSTASASSSSLLPC